MRSDPRRLARGLLPRIFIVLAASLLIIAIAAATLTPADTTLLDALHSLDAKLVAGAQTWVTAEFGAGLWQNWAVPLLVRPVWLIPVSLGLICAGAAVSTSLAPPKQTRHRRS